MVAHEGNDCQEFSYQEVIAALPAYAQGQLATKERAAVDAYLNRQVDLFRRLDSVETAQSAGHKAPKPHQGSKQTRMRFREFESTTAFAQVMEGYASPQALPDNPLLMRKAPQRITDQRTGQRFIIPRRNRALAQGHGYPQPERATPWSTRLSWGLLALAAVVAMILIGLHQLRLQQQLADYQRRAALATFPTTTGWLTTAAHKTAPLGALFITERQATVVIQNLPPLPAGQRYQLWLFDDQAAPYPAASFSGKTSTEPFWVTFALPPAMHSLTQMGVTIETEEQGTHPSGPFLLTGTLP